MDYEGSGGDQDEVTQRRAQKRIQSGSGSAGSENDLERTSWADTLAIIIATYQVLLPIVLASIGVLLAVYLFFHFYFG